LTFSVLTKPIIIAGVMVKLDYTVTEQNKTKFWQLFQTVSHSIHFYINTASLLLWNHVHSTTTRCKATTTAA